MSGAVARAAGPSLVEPEAGEPEELARELVRVIPTLVRLVGAEVRGAPHTADLNLAQFRVLARLYERDYRVSELADGLCVGRPSLTVTAEHLVRRGLIERCRELPNDRRAVLLRLTPAGHAVYRALQARMIDVLAELLARTSPAERSSLAVGLAALGRCLEASGRRLPPRAAADRRLR
jgi:DNA-binding MarR family transcriptional regulator